MPTLLSQQQGCFQFPVGFRHARVPSVVTAFTAAVARLGAASHDPSESRGLERGRKGTRGRPGFRAVLNVRGPCGRIMRPPRSKLLHFSLHRLHIQTSLHFPCPIRSNRFS
mmetsp:Transcript_27946/g.58180  ORF Transcript_27946/g.58180 Transcript_27946/m.58180 type:complete len:111 (-) Transcript_27946:1634-1966(-)